MTTDLIPPTSLTDLADRINAEHGKVKESLVRGASHAIACGKLLWQAKGKVRHGQWLEWLPANCQFSERTAQLYMKLAQDLPLIESNPQRIADLTMTDAIKMVEDLKSPVEALPGSSPKRGLGKKTDRVAEAIKNSPLAIAERAWDQMGDNEKSIFRTKIERELSLQIENKLPAPPTSPQTAARPSTATETADRALGPSDRR